LCFPSLFVTKKKNGHKGHNVALSARSNYFYVMLA
jgi:hypothetical protein